jgi:hypothetical protein
MSGSTRREFFASTGVLAAGWLQPTYFPESRTAGVLFTWRH